MKKLKVNHRTIKRNTQKKSAFNKNCDCFYLLFSKFVRLIALCVGFFLRSIHYYICERTKQFRLWHESVPNLYILYEPVALHHTFEQCVVVLTIFIRLFQFFCVALWNVSCCLPSGIIIYNESTN